MCPASCFNTIPPCCPHKDQPVSPYRLILHSFVCPGSSFCSQHRLAPSLCHRLRMGADGERDDFCWIFFFTFLKQKNPKPNHQQKKPQKNPNTHTKPQTQTIKQNKKTQQTKTKPKPAITSTQVLAQSHCIRGQPKQKARL